MDKVVTGPPLAPFEVNLLRPYTGPSRDRVSQGYQECLEIGVFESTNSYCSVVNVPAEELTNWLSPASRHPFANGSQDVKPERALRLLLCPLPSTTHASLPFTEAHFGEIKDLFLLKDDCLQSEDLQGPNIWFRVPEKDSVEGFVIRVDKFNKSLAAFSLSISYNQTTNIVAGVLCIRIQEELNHVGSRIQQLHRHLWHPLFLAAILLETRTRDIPDLLVKHKTAITRLEDDAGVYKNQFFQDTLDPNTLAPSEDRDFDGVLNDLIPIKSDCDYRKFKCQTALELLDFLDKYYSDTQNIFGNSLCVSSSVKLLGSKLAHERIWLTNLLLRCNYVVDRASALQAQCYTHMAQRDNWLNLQTSKTSKDIALSTQKDSTDMRSIAVVTLIFFPATFVATFFSTSFYDFTPNDGRLVSKWYWIYWVVTIALTLLVLAAWVTFRKYLGYVEKKKQKEEEERREKAKISGA